MSDTVLVTGATGVIGSRLCRELVDAGWNVRAMRRESSDTTHLADLDLEWCVGDVLDPEACRSAVEGCSHVCHLAGVGLGDAPPETVEEVNETGTRNVLEASRREGVDRFLFTSTAGTRRSPGVADESDHAEPIGAYQRSKAAAEEMVQEACAEGLDAVVVHPTSVFAPGDGTFTERLCRLASEPTLVAYLPGGASFVDVDDVATGIRLALERGESGEHYVLGGENLTYDEALGVIADAADGYPPRVRVPPSTIHLAGHAAGVLDVTAGVRVFPFDPEMAKLATRRLFYTSEKARRELGYTSKPLVEYVDDAVEWYRTAAD